MRVRRQNTTLKTRKYAYDDIIHTGTLNDYGLHPEWYDDSTDNRLFLLSYEEINYGLRDSATSSRFGNDVIVKPDSMATTGLSVMRTSGNHTLFGDLYARRTNRLDDTDTTVAVSGYWWLRSPNFITGVLVVQGLTGTAVGGGNYSESYGVRPACWINLS